MLHLMILTPPSVCSKPRRKWVKVNKKKTPTIWCISHSLNDMQKIIGFEALPIASGRQDAANTPSRHKQAPWTAPQPNGWQLTSKMVSAEGEVHHAWVTIHTTAALWHSPSSGLRNSRLPSTGGWALPHWGPFVRATLVGRGGWRHASDESLRQPRLRARSGLVLNCWTYQNA